MRKKQFHATYEAIYNCLTIIYVFFYIFNVAITCEHARASVSPVNEENEVDRLVSSQFLNPIHIPSLKNHITLLG